MTSKRNSGPLKMQISTVHALAVRTDVESVALKYSDRFPNPVAPVLSLWPLNWLYYYTCHRLKILSTEEHSKEP